MLRAPVGKFSRNQEWLSIPSRLILTAGSATSSRMSKSLQASLAGTSGGRL